MREALCTLANGYFGTRAAAPEASASKVHYPGTYMAGLYNRLKTRISGKTVENEDFVNCPNWLFLTFKIGTSDWFRPSTDNIVSFHQELDMRRGRCSRRILFEDLYRKQTLIETVFLVSMANPHIGALKYVITPKNYSNWITVKSMLDGSVVNQGVERYKKLNSKHWRPFSLGFYDDNTAFLSMRTSQSRTLVSQACRVRIYSEGQALTPETKNILEGKEAVGQEFKIFVHRNKSYVVDKTVSIYSSKEKDTAYPSKAAVKALKNTGSFDEVCNNHEKAWLRLWDKADIRVEGDTFSQKILRLHIFHLLQTASPHSARIDAGLPARGLHGEAYRGHIFWDELFARPFYDLHIPEVTESLLLYRYRRLSEARRYARANAYRGAMFPWQSGSSGREETQVIHLNPMSGKWGPDLSSRQRHISFAIAYNVWKHYSLTGDFNFFLKYGAEIFLSIAQFCASLIRYDPKDGRFHTQGIMGPDEFHEKLPLSRTPGLRDNAYSNLMISWVLSKANEIFTILPMEHKRSLLRRLRLREKEIRHWADMAKKMKIIFNEKGIISQFEGYFKLREINWERYRAKYHNIHRLDRILKAEGNSPDDYKVSKQADSLMIFYLFTLSEAEDIFKNLGYSFDAEKLRKNYQYYIKRTSHGSSLSKVVHCFIAHKLGFYNDSWDLFVESLEADFYDIQGGTALEGIHLGVMGGTVYIVRKAFAGVEFLKDRIRIEPSLPKSWHKLEFKFFYRGRWISLTIRKSQVIIFIHALGAKPLSFRVEVNRQIHDLFSGKIYKIPLRDKDKSLS